MEEIKSLQEHTVIIRTVQWILLVILQYFEDLKIIQWFGDLVPGSFGKDSNLGNIKRFPNHQENKPAIGTIE